MKTPLFFRAGCLVRILAGCHAGVIGTIEAIVLDRNFVPLIVVSFMDNDTGRFIKAVYLRGELELLPSDSEALLAYIRMGMDERAAA